MQFLLSAPQAAHAAYQKFFGYSLICHFQNFSSFERERITPKRKDNFLELLQMTLVSTLTKDLAYSQKPAQNIWSLFLRETHYLPTSKFLIWPILTNNLRWHVMPNQCHSMELTLCHMRHDLVTLPALTVTASINCSFHDEVETTSETLAFRRSLSTVLWKTT